MMATANLGAGDDRTRNRIVLYCIGRVETLVHEIEHAGHLLVFYQMFILGNDLELEM